MAENKKSITPYRMSKIDQSQFEYLVQQGNDIATVCNYFGISAQTLRRWIKKTYNMDMRDKFDELHGKSKTRLLDIGWRLAESSTAAWIFMMKNLYGWSDQPVVQPNDDASDSLSDSFKAAAKSINTLADLASVPDKDEEGV